MKYYTDFKWQIQYKLAKRPKDLETGKTLLKNPKFTTYLLLVLGQDIELFRASVSSSVKRG